MQRVSTTDADDDEIKDEAACRTSPVMCGAQTVRASVDAVPATRKKRGSSDSIGSSAMARAGKSRDTGGNCGRSSGRCEATTDARIRADAENNNEEDQDRSSLQDEEDYGLEERVRRQLHEKMLRRKQNQYQNRK